PLFLAAPPPAQPPAAAPGPEAAAARLAGFWPRVGAFLIDAILLGGIGQLLGLLFYDQLCALGPWGRPLGFLIALAYLVPLTSALGGGRTLGKRALQLQVVDRRGRPLSAGRAALRESVLILPSFLNHALVPAGFNTAAVGTAMSIGIFVVGPTLIYLLVFNRRTRQGLHDLLAGSYVVE